ncbi:MAG: M15 family metallopeptidase [Oscillospiraceae bacterium]|nr:M15 family metallopeptidase [Oscillospiraceae bacterium]
MAAVRKRKRYRGRRLRPQFILFCAVMLALLCGLVLLVRRAPVFRRPADTPSATREIVETPEPKENDVPAGFVPAEGDIHAGSLILVSNEHPYTFPAEVELVTTLEQNISGYMARDYSVKQEKTAFAAFDALFRAFADTTGRQDVNISSAYRSYDEQQEVYAASAAENGEAHAASYVTQPGCSEHHTGLAVDLTRYDVRTGHSYDFTGEGEYGWIHTHGPEYGVVMRYAADKESITGIAEETWHLRYVGVPHAAYMAEHNLCLEEYLDLLRSYPVTNPLRCNGCHIYFCPEGQLVVPESGDYTVSGNNVDGFVVTIP